MTDISEALMAKVTSRMCQAPILDLATTVDESESVKEPILELKRKTLKSGKLRTTGSSVLHKVAWLHEVV